MSSPRARQAPSAVCMVGFPSFTPGVRFSGVPALPWFRVAVSLPAFHCQPGFLWFVSSPLQTRQLSGAEASPVSWPALYPGRCELSTHPGSCEKCLQLWELGGFSQGTPSGAQTLPGALAEREAGPAVRHALGSQGPGRMLE